jgi:5'(3')-deoxyribonucleotidase
MKGHLCVDVDNCVAATDAVIRGLISRVTGGRVNFVYEDIGEFDYHGPRCCDAKGNRIDERVWDEVHELFSDPGVILTIAPVRGATDALRVLQENFDLHFVTTRKPKTRIATIQWLDGLKLATYWLHFVQHRKKHMICGGVAAAIDDDAAQAELFHGCGVRAIVLAHPWNEGAGHGVERLADWDTVVRALIS